MGQARETADTDFSILGHLAEKPLDEDVPVRGVLLLLVALPK